MMTCGSERSGMASRGILRNDHTPYSVRQTDRTTISPRLRADNSMMRLIIWFVSARCNVGLRDPNHGLVFLDDDGGLLRPGHLNLDLARINSVPNFGQCCF